MANCPKCNAHLKITDWKQHCPHCGANIVVYDLQERLMKEADVAEVQYYHFQKKIDRVKASFVGSKLAITRICTSLLPAGALFLPLFSGKITEPFAPMEGNVSLITIINSFGSFGDDALSALLANPALAVAVSGLALSVVLTLVHFIFLTLSCSPKGKIRNIIQDILLIVFTISSVIGCLALPKNGVAVGTLGYGAILYLVLQIANVVIDIATLKQGIEIHHKQCYVGGIPIEEYFQMVENGATLEEIRKVQYAKLQEIQDEKERKLLEDEAKKEKQEETVS